MKKNAEERIHAARDRLRKHLKYKGKNCDFNLNEQFCHHWWRQLNITVFDSMLTPPVRFEYRAFRDFLGWCKPWRCNSHTRRVTVGISTDVFDRKEFLCILAHEMVHQWEWEILASWKPNVTHSKDFFSWKNKMKTRAGLPLKATY